MTAYIKLSTFEYPRHEGDIRVEHPGILDSQTGESFPCPETYAPVQWTEPPAIDRTTQSVEQGAPELVDGVWRTTWVVRRLTQKELDAIAEIEKRSSWQSVNAPGTAPDVID